MEQFTPKSALTAEPPGASAATIGAGYAWYALVVLVLFSGLAGIVGGDGGPKIVGARRRPPRRRRRRACFKRV